MTTMGINQLDWGVPYLMFGFLIQEKSLHSFLLASQWEKTFRNTITMFPERTVDFATWSQVVHALQSKNIALLQATMRAGNMSAHQHNVLVHQVNMAGEAALTTIRDL